MKNSVSALLLCILLIAGFNCKNKTTTASLKNSDQSQTQNALNNPGVLDIVTSDWPPYQMIVDGKNTGFATEIIEQTLGNMDIDFSINFYPWSRCINLVKTGKSDAIYSASVNSEREQFLTYPGVLLHSSEYVFFVHKNKTSQIKFEEYDDIRKYRVGLTRGYAYDDEFWKTMKEYNNYVISNSDADNVKLLARQQIDLFACEKLNGIALLKELNLTGEVTYLEKVFISKSYFLAFSKNSNYPEKAAFLTAFEEALERFKKSSEYKKIEKKYFTP